MKRRIKHDYRQTSPGRFLSTCQTVKRSLSNNTNYPDELWGSHLTLRQRLFDNIDRTETAHHLASNGDRVLIRERDRLMEETVDLLDQTASFLEAVSVQNPDALFTTGFSIAQERRNTTRTKLPLVPPMDFHVVNTGEPRKAVASATPVPGAFNQEIHINRNDPSVEADWFHKGIYHDASNMVLENVDPGNAFFRMRFHGADGAGPWSPTVNTTIS